MKYLIVADTPVYRVSERCFAIESCFGETLQKFAQKMHGAFHRFVIAAPSYSPAEYERLKSNLLHIDSLQAGIECEPLQIYREGKFRFWLQEAWSVIPKLSQLTQEADLVHTELSMNLWRPFEFIAVLFAIRRKRKSIFVVGADFRRLATMNLLTKRWPLRTWLAHKLFSDPLRQLQLAIATDYCSVVLVKSEKLAQDFGAHNPRVHHFRDVIHSADQIAPPETLAKRAALLRDPNQPLELVYIGRLASDTGVEQILRALALVRERSAAPFRLHLLGGGAEKPHLQGIAEALRIARFIVFHDVTLSGPALSAMLRDCHLLLVTPMQEETPQSVFCAMASGLPILAYNTDAYRELAQKSGAILLSPWNEPRKFSTHLIEINKNREQLTALSERALAFAQDNTQEVWLDRRVAWTLQSLEKLSAPCTR